MRHHPTNVPRRAPGALALGALALLGAAACGGSRPAALPASTSVDPGRRYVFYLHSELSEQMGDTARTRRHGRYERERIVREIGERGFTVVAPLRGPDTDATAYADTVIRQVRELIAGGVPAERITITGFQKGGHIALLVAARSRNPVLNYVVMAACPRRATPEDLKAIGNVEGRILSMYGEEDRQAGSCKRLFEQSPGPIAVRETEFANRADAGYFYRPARGWMNRLEDWAKDAKAPLMVAPGAELPKREE
jgi:predicted esterase